MKKNILAKFNPNETIEEHIKNALSVYESIKESFIWIPSITKVDDFWAHLFYAVVLHDIGKSATGFQKDPLTWGYRHEILSTPFTQFLSCPDFVKNSIAMSILTHHKYLDKISLKLPPDYKLPVKSEYEIKLEELLENIDYVKDYFRIVKKWESDYKTGENFFESEDLENDLRKYNFYSLVNWYNKEVKKNKLYFIFLKGLLNAIDHLSSSGEKNILILPDILDGLNKIIPQTRELQSQALETYGNTIMKAPTGYGKTEASLLWAHRNMDQRYSNRLFYILPYKTSINAMYERFSRKYFQEKNIVGMYHSSSDYYYYIHNEDYRKLKNLYRKIYLPAKISTPFQLMKGIFGVGYYEMEFSELSNSVMILDEIHAYEDNITGILLGMLEVLTNEYGCKTLIMSATLPSFIEELFVETLNPKKLTIKDQELDNFNRHRVQISEGDIFNAIDSIGNILNSCGKPLLIVCNTVDRAIDIYNKLKDKYRSLLIHGRFCHLDRQKIEEELKNNFNNYEVVVATQVIEVSLDLSFSTIITEPAPLDALVQRFGRVNRQGWQSKQIKPISILTKGSTKDHYVYDKKLVDNSLSQLMDINGEVLRESKIQDLMDNVYMDFVDESCNNITFAKENTLEIYKDLEPMKKSNSEDEFYNLFKAFEVIPTIFHEEVNKAILEGKYIDIYRYKVPLSFSKYYAISKKYGDCFFKDETIDPKSNIIFTNLCYTNEFGLLTDSFNRDPKEYIF